MQITPHLINIIKLISTNDVVSIVAPTGSGKSVAVPAAIASSGSRCFVTVPTRTAAISLAEYQRLLQKNVSPETNVNALVGYAAEGNINYDKRTLIAYVTGGHARKKMLSYFSNGIPSAIDFCDVLMVDEVHSGSLDNTIIISLWLKAMQAGVLVPRLVIASATPIPLDIYPPPKLYTVDLAAFPIEYRYLDKNISLDDTTGLLFNEAGKIAANIHRNTPINSGHILIFAAGSSEVESIASAVALSLKIPVPGKVATIIPAFGAIKQEELALIYKDTAPNERKIVIATNIAEMSITISDVGHVIDTLIEKRAETSQSGGLRLTTHYISKDSAKQRAGRTGRTRPGVCYRMSTKQFFETLEEHRPPEIDRIPIYEIIMELYDVGLTPDTIMGLDKSRADKAIKMLTKLKMIISTPEGILVTDKGHFSTNFNLSVRNAAFLWNWMNPIKTFDNRLITQAKVMFNINLEQMEIDATSNYSSIKPYHMDQVANVLASEQINPNSIIDATANVGGDTINFLRLFPSATVWSIELDPNTASILRRNIQHLPAILGTKKQYQAKAINMSAVDYFKQPRYADLIYFDPPWGGSDYYLQPEINLELDGIRVGIIIDDILSAGMTSLVILKVPTNANLNQLMDDIKSNISAQSHDIINPTSNKVDFRLIIIRSFGIDLLSPDVMLSNIPDEVPLVTNSYPIFPGIVIAALIDSYGPSYFWVPRRSKDTTPGDHNKIVIAHKEKYFSKYIGYSDLDTSLNMWQDLINTTGTIYPSQKVLSSWSRNNSINNKKIKELLLIIDRSIKSLERLNYKVEVGLFTTSWAVAEARPILASVYSDQVLTHRKDVTYYNPSNRATYRLDTREAINELHLDPPDSIIALSTIEIKTQRNAINIIGFALDNIDNKQKGKQVKTLVKQDIAEELNLLQDLKLGVEEEVNLSELTLEEKDKFDNAAELVNELKFNDDPLELLYKIMEESQNIITLLPLQDASDEQLKELSIIGSDPVVYSKLSHNKPWTEEYVRQLRDYSLTDTTNDYLHRIILENGVVVGYIGLHPTGTTRLPGSQIRLFVDTNKSGRGIATKATKELFNQLKGFGTLWTLVAPDNIASIRVAIKGGSKYRENIKLKGGVELQVYSIDL